MRLNNFRDKETNTIPYIEVRFTTVYGDKLTVNNQNLSDNIVAIQTTKTMGNIVGQFSITMVGQTNFSDLLTTKIGTRTGGWGLFRPAGLVDIYIEGSEVMLGLITTIQKSVDMTSGTPQRFWTITGTDLGAMLMKTRIWYDMATNEDRPEQNAYFAGLREFTNIVSKEKVANIISTLFTDWYANIINKAIPAKNIKGFKFSDGTGILDKLIVKPFGQGGALSTNLFSDLYYVQLSVFTQQTDIFSYFQELACAPLNELFLDTGGYDFQLDTQTTFKSKNNKCYLCIRATPYDDTALQQVKFIVKNDLIPAPDQALMTPLSAYTLALPAILKMQDLPSITVDDSLIQTKTLQMTSETMPSAYHIQPMNNFLANGNSQVLIAPEYDNIALNRYGYSVLSIPLNGYDFSDVQPRDLFDLCQTLQVKIKNWYQFNDSLLSGDMTIQGNSDIKIGTVLNYDKYDGKIEDDYEEGHYYITGVQHNWRYAQKYVTNLTLERGVSKMFYR